MSARAMCATRSTTLHAYPHSLSYHANTLTKFWSRATHAEASKTHDADSPMKSDDTAGSSTYETMPFISPSAACLTAALTASIEAGRSRRTVRSTTETSGTGTRSAKPVSFPSREGRTLPSASAAPLEVGTMLKAPRPLRQSLAWWASTVGCDTVRAWTVVMRPPRSPKASSSILASGARQFVVHEALLTMSGAPSTTYRCSLTPTT